MSKATLLCPSCKKVVPMEAAVRPPAFPFCSDRCKLSDLGRWFEEDYALPQPLGPDDHEAIEEVIRARQGDS
ncbi:MAG: DNA gyrase inhibitor YacG [Proteobacteria bacterium]|nr:DNA gyrase inhibitor YacG [Pseudomonadota bacterium]